MKKILLSLATLVGLGVFSASAEQVTLNVADASSIEGTFVEAAGTSNAHYQPVSSFKIGDYTFTASTEGTNASQQPALYYKGETMESFRMYGKAKDSKFSIAAPEGTKITGVTLNAISKYANGTLACDAGKVTKSGTTYTTAAFQGKDQVNFTVTEDQIRFSSFEITYQASAPAAPVDLSSILAMSMPDDETIADGGWETSIFTMMAFTKTVAPNMSCTTPAVMTLNGQPVGEALLPSSPFVILDGVSEMAEAGQQGQQLMMVFVPEQTSLAPGTYKMTIPAGFLTIEGAPNAEYSQEWVVAGNTPGEVDANTVISDMVPNRTDITPAEYWEGNVVAVQFSIQGSARINYGCTTPITMTLNGNEFGYKVLPGSQWIDTMEDSEPYAVGDDTKTVTMVGIAFNMPETEEPVADGRYVMTIPAGFFTIDGAPMSAYTYEWTVGKVPVVTPEYTLIPENGAVLTEGPADLFVNFPGKTVEVAGNKDNITLTATNGKTSSIFATMPMTDGVDLMLMTALEGGEWTATIPAGFFTVDGASYDKAISWTFTVDIPEQIRPTVIPAEGEVSAQEIKAVKLVFPADKTITIGEEDTYAVTLEDIDDPMAGMKMYNAALDANDPHTVILTPQYDSAIKAGFYALTIGEGTYFVDGEKNARFELNYHVTEGTASEITFTLTPADGATVNIGQIDDIYVTVQGALSVSASAPLTVTDGTTTVSLNAISRGNQLDYMFLTEKPAVGVWTVNIPANSITIDGTVYAEAITWSFTVEASSTPAGPEVTVEPAEGQITPQQLKTITLSYEEGTVLEMADEGSYYIALEKEGDTEQILYTGTVEGNKVVLTPEVEKEFTEGNYTLSIYPNAYTINGEGCPMLTLHYTVTPGSVELIGIDVDGAVNVYNAGGMIIIRNGSAADLDRLPAGLYIINGKKVMLRK